MSVVELYAAATFDHLDWHFDTGDPVDPSHPMVALRPDLFTTTKPPRRKTPKE